MCCNAVSQSKLQCCKYSSSSNGLYCRMHVATASVTCVRLLPVAAFVKLYVCTHNVYCTVMLVHTQPPAKQCTQATRKQDFKERHSVHVLHYSTKWIPNKIQQLPFDRHDIYSVYSAIAAV
jgi:hypothetical protein